MAWYAQPFVLATKILLNIMCIAIELQDTVSHNLLIELNVCATRIAFTVAPSFGKSKVRTHRIPHAIVSRSPNAITALCASRKINSVAIPFLYILSHVALDFTIFYSKESNSNIFFIKLIVL